MHNARFRLMAGLAGATLCLFAAASYGQNTSTQTGTANGTATTPDASAQTTSPTNTPATTPDASAQAPTTTGTVTTGTDTRTTSTDATTTTTTGFPGGTLGILAVAVLVLLILFALFRGRDRTTVRETSVSSSAATPGARTTAGTAGGERMNLDSRAASGTTSTTSTTGMNDPNARR
jgi:hypothetical protein